MKGGKIIAEYVMDIKLAKEKMEKTMCSSRRIYNY